MDTILNNELEALKKELIQLKNKSPKNEDAIRIQLDKVGRKCEDLGKYNEALSYYKECLEVEKKILPSNHSSIADTLHSIGSLYDDQDNYEEALKYYNQSLEMKKRTLPSNHYSIANTLVCIGLSLYNQRKIEEALKYYNKSLEIYKQTLPSNHASIANTLNNIGMVYDEQGKYEEALKYYNQSLEMKKQIFPSNPTSIANTLNNIGILYNNQRKIEEALKYYNQSLEIYKQTLPSNHPAILKSLKNINIIGKVYYDQGKYEHAIKYLTDEKLKEDCRKKLSEQQQKKNEVQTERRNIQRDISQLSLSSSSSFRNVDIEDPYIDKVFNGRYKVSKKLGSGSFGFVYLIKDMTLNKEELRDGNRAMKIMNNCDSATENELKIFWKINHENIVKYIDHFHIKIGSDDKTCLITEFCENGDLKHHIDERKKSGRKFNEMDILKWMCQATNALKYLHSMEPKPIIHRDIKPANMLLSDRMQIKIADLGLSKIVDLDKTHASTQAGTPIYMSPEVFRALTDDVKHYPNTDVWYFRSLGCVLYELFFLEYAFPRGQRGNPPLPLNVSSCGIFSDILPKMLEKDPLMRIKSKKLMKEFILLDEDDD